MFLLIFLWYICVPLVVYMKSWTTLQINCGKRDNKTQPEFFLVAASGGLIFSLRRPKIAITDAGCEAESCGGLILSSAQTVIVPGFEWNRVKILQPPPTHPPQTHLFRTVTVV